MTRIILSCMIGNALEWYAFVIFGFFAPTISLLFFPEENNTIGLIKTFGLFSVAFIARPLGAIILGHIGDKTSRKKALLLSIFVMAIPTVLIGCLPTYHIIGVVAPILLAILLITQGFAIGGEFTGSMIFMIEHAPTHKQGLIGSLATFSCVLGVILGSIISLICTHFLTYDTMLRGGWRISFLLTFVGAALGVYMRRNINDPNSVKHQKRSQAKYLPFKEIFMNYKKEILQVILIDFITAIGFFLLVIFLPTYLQSPVYLGLDPEYVLRMHTFNMIIFAVFTLLGGFLADHYDRKWIFMYVAIVFLVGGYVLFMMLQTKSYWILFIAQFIFSFHMGIFFGAIPLGLSEIFPPHIRFTGLSVSHNVSMALFGGSAPLLATAAIEITQDLASPGYLLMIASLFCIVGVLLRNSKKLI